MKYKKHGFVFSAFVWSIIDGWGDPIAHSGPTKYLEKCANRTRLYHRNSASWNPLRCCLYLRKEGTHSFRFTYLRIRSWFFIQKPYRCSKCDACMFIDFNQVGGESWLISLFSHFSGVFIGEAVLSRYFGHGNLVRDRLCTLQESSF